MNVLRSIIIGLLLLLILSSSFSETIAIKAVEGLRYTWGLFPRPPLTIDGPAIPLTVESMTGVERATIEIDVWRFKIESLNTFNSGFSYRFEQNGSRVTIIIERKNSATSSANIGLQLIPNYTEPRWEKNTKTFGQFRIVRANFEFREGVENRIAEFHHGSWYVYDDNIMNGWSVNLFSKIDNQPLNGVYVQLVGLADTPTIFSYEGKRFGLDTNEDGYSFATLPDFDPSILHDGDGFPAWFYLDFPEGSPYESRVMKVHSQPPNHNLHFELYVSPTSSAHDWQMYQ
ncbi:MAG: hypothetical protein P9L94_13085 [Candidatus Hinthialibacter antarcticus]|nr:hypothetical protein [Candidatus Hinthialibacter antarcticus]